MPEVVGIEQYREAAEDLEAVRGVETADVLEHDPRLNRPLIEVVVGPGYDRVPPRVHRKIAEYDLGTRNQMSRGEEFTYWVVEVV